MIWALLGTGAAGVIAYLVQEIRVRGRDTRIEKLRAQLAELADAVEESDADLQIESDRSDRCQAALGAARAELDRYDDATAARIADGSLDIDAVRDDADSLFGTTPAGGRVTMETSGEINTSDWKADDFRDAMIDEDLQ